MGLSFLLVLVIMALNFGISWWNAMAVGKVWVEVKEIGGWQQFMAWMGAIMSAIGFTWTYLIVLVFGFYFLEPMWLKPGQEALMTMEAVEAAFSLGYIIIVPGLLFSGLMIWINSLIVAWRNRSVANMGIGVWNTFAMAHNTYSAMKGMPEAWKIVGKFFSTKGGDSKGKAVIMIIGLVVVALIGGVLTTTGLIKKYAGSVELPKRPAEVSRYRRY